MREVSLHRRRACVVAKGQMARKFPIPDCTSSMRLSGRRLHDSPNILSKSQHLKNVCRACKSLKRRHETRGRLMQAWLRSLIATGDAHRVARLVVINGRWARYLSAVSDPLSEGAERKRKGIATGQASPRICEARFHVGSDSMVTTRLPTLSNAVCSSCLVLTWRTGGRRGRAVISRVQNRGLPALDPH